MSTHRAHDENGDFFIRKSGNSFFLFTDGTAGSGTVPGAPQSFTFSGGSPTQCSSTTSVSFNWSAPYDNGGSPITGYAIRQVAVYFDDSQTTSPWISVPTTVLSNFKEPCTGGSDEGSPLVIGNITSLDIDNYACGYYAYQIAAINANGTGVFVPDAGSVNNVHYTDVGDDNISYSVTGSNINVTYISNQGDCSYTNYQNTSGNLYSYDGSGPGSVVSTYSSYSPGTLSFTKPGTAGWYYADVYETWTDYTNSCTEKRSGCLIQPIYVS